MALKPGAKDCVVKEQIIECVTTGLTFQFHSCGDDSAYGCIITVQGDNLPYGNRPVLYEGRYLCTESRILRPPGPVGRLPG